MGCQAEGVCWEGLRGVRVWLSGAVPEGIDAKSRETIGEFVREFSAALFRSGAHVLHGSHPTITPILVEQAKRHVANGGQKDCLTLVVSRYWSKDSNALDLSLWRETCMVYETPEAPGNSGRDDSLLVMRKWLMDRSDAFVAIGGMWWSEVSGRSGVPIEASLAIQKGLPCFLAGGLPGATQKLLLHHPELLKKLRNGLDDISNAALADSDDKTALISTICSQLSRLPLVRGQISDGLSFRILALDGGGIKGAFTASVLATLETQLGITIVDHFDIIAGTSTGGILALGLGAGLSASELLNFYRERGSTIFPVTSFHKKFAHKIRHLFAPKYSQSILYNEIRNAFAPANQGVILSDSKCRLVIPAYDTVTSACHVFRTPHAEFLQADRNTSILDVAVATAAAPTYFSTASVDNSLSNTTYIDGGIWANCPAMAAIVEAVCYLGVPIDRIDVLSIGTTEEPFSVKEKKRRGIFGWATSIAKLLMNAQMDSNLRHAEGLLGKPRFMRINAMTVPGQYSMDGADGIEDLISLGNKAGSNPGYMGDIKSRFLNGVHVSPWK